MLKREELAILDRAIGELGAQSYLGPWLHSVRAEVQASIVSDLEPALLPGEAYTRAAQMIESARKGASEIMATAQAAADRLSAETKARVDQFRARARRDLERNSR